MEVRGLLVWAVAVVALGYGWLRLRCRLVAEVGLGVAGAGRVYGVPGCSVWRKSGNRGQWQGGRLLQEGQGAEVMRSSAAVVTALA